MTPTPEMVAMAERIGRGMDDASVYHEARKRMMADMTGSDIDLHLVRVAGERAALTAIMEVSEKAADYMRGFPIGCSADCRSLDHVGSAIEAIRNGDHLR